MTLPPLPLDQILTQEDFLIVVDNRFYTIGSTNPGPEENKITIDGTSFSLEEGETVKNLLNFYVDQNSEQLEQILVNCLGEKGHKYESYLVENKIFDFILKVFERLKPEIGYKEFLKMENFAPLEVPGKEELEKKFGSEFQEPVRDDLFSHLVKDLRGKLNYDSENALMFKGVFYYLTPNHSDNDETRISADINGKSYLQRKQGFINGISNKVKGKIEQFIQGRISAISLRDRMELAQRHRHYLQRKFQEGDYLSHGLVFRKSEEDGQYQIKLVLPTYFIKVPRRPYHIRFRQAELKSKIITDTSKVKVVTSCTNSIYSRPEQHPLVYPRGWDEEFQVCLREYSKEFNRAYTEDVAKNLANHFLICRQTLLYGLNMFNLFDPGSFLHGLNAHRINKWKFRNQRVYKVEEGSLIVDSGVGL